MSSSSDASPRRSAPLLTSVHRALGRGERPGIADEAVPTVARAAAVDAEALPHRERDRRPVVRDMETLPPVVPTDAELADPTRYARPTLVTSVRAGRGGAHPLVMPRSLDSAIGMLSVMPYDTDQVLVGGQGEARLPWRMGATLQGQLHLQRTPEATWAVVSPETSVTPRGLHVALLSPPPSPSAEPPVAVGHPARVLLTLKEAQDIEAVMAEAAERWVRTDGAAFTALALAGAVRAQRVQQHAVRQVTAMTEPIAQGVAPHLLTGETTLVHLDAALAAQAAADAMVREKEAALVQAEWMERDALPTWFFTHPASVEEEAAARVAMKEREAHAVEATQRYLSRVGGAVLADRPEPSVAPPLLPSSGSPRGMAARGGADLRPERPRRVR